MQRFSKCLRVWCAIAAAISCIVLVRSDFASGGAETRPQPGSAWRLAHETFAADSEQAFLEGANALQLKMPESQRPGDAPLRHCPADNPAALNKLAYWGHLVTLPAGTRVTTVGSERSGATVVRVLDGKSAGKVRWLYPLSPEELGFVR